MTSTAPRSNEKPKTEEESWAERIVCVDKEQEKRGEPADGKAELHQHCLFGAVGVPRTQPRRRQHPQTTRSSRDRVPPFTPRLRHGRLAHRHGILTESARLLQVADRLSTSLVLCAHRDTEVSPSIASKTRSTPGHPNGSLLRMARRLCLLPGLGVVGTCKII